MEPAREQPVAFYRKLLPGQLPAAITLPGPYPEKVFHLESHELRIIEQGHTDAAGSTALHVPSIDLVLGGACAFWNVWDLLSVVRPYPGRQGVTADVFGAAALS